MAKKPSLVEEVVEEVVAPVGAPSQNGLKPEPTVGPGGYPSRDFKHPLNG